MDKTMDSISVLIVDNNLTFLRIVRRFLEELEGVTIVGAIQASTDVLERITVLEPNVVLIDITMPNLPGGVHFISRLREALPGANIIALTLINTEGYRQAALEAGADDFVPKADVGAGLIAAMQRIRRAIWQQSEMAVGV
jgi:two-component system response regulator NreC